MVKLKLSASAIKTYEQCPRKYYYTYINKPKIEKKEWPHLKIGNFVHEVLDQFHTILQTEPGHKWPELMSNVCKKNVASFALDKEQRATAGDMLRGYLGKLDKEGLPNVVASEQKFNIMLTDDVLIRGFIDRIDEDDDDGEQKYHIVDYKTGKSKYLDEIQLLVYGLYLQEKVPDLERFKGSYVMLAEDSRHHMLSIFTKTDLDKVKKKILGVADSIMNDQTWEPKVQFLCKYCDFNGVCPASPHKQVEPGRKGEWS